MYYTACCQPHDSHRDTTAANSPASCKIPDPESVASLIKPLLNRLFAKYAWTETYMHFSRPVETVQNMLFYLSQGQVSNRISNPLI
ncbi:hypothetical protein PABG_11259 [Paracoccidioides brasiliensis Pb03]|nr:hypothetical protein PABG_11259 [Paracoccidioides brasiliensis Pb03]